MNTTKLIPSRELYMQIRWDPRLSLHNFTITYEERLGQRTMREIPLVDFVPDGDVPWHRVWRFSHQGQTVWDRAKRISTLTELLHSPAPQKTIETNGEDTKPTLHREYAWAFDLTSQCWQPSRSMRPPGPGPQRLTVATWNILMESNKIENICPKARQAALFQNIIELQTDILVLQEVRADFLRQLMELPQIQRRYTLSTLPDGQALHPYGQVVMSRFPLNKVWRYDDSQSKHHVWAEVLLPDTTLAICAVHLTSDMASQAATKRRRQLQVALDELIARYPEAQLLLVGDLNTEDQGLEALSANHFTDLWRATRPEEVGATFDPLQNSLAKINSRTGKPRRLDQIWMRSDRLVPLHSDLFATARFGTGPLDHLSDHFGVRCTLYDTQSRRATNLEEPINVRNALAILPPPEQCAAIQRIRARHDPSFARWQPHINLLYGFLPADIAGSEASAIIQDFLQQQGPIHIHLEGLRTFRHKHTTTIWLAPHKTTRRALGRLEHHLRQAFPQCSAQTSRGPHGYQPHLTLARVDNDQDIEALQKAWSKILRPITWEANELTWLTRGPDDPFSTYQSFSLPTCPSTALLDALQPYTLSATQHQERQDHIHHLQTFADTHFQPAPLILPVGSTAMNAHGPESDLDLLVVAPHELSSAAFFEAIQTILPVTQISDATQEIQVAKVDGLKIELQFANLPLEVAPQKPDTLAPGILNSLDEDTGRALASYTEATWLLHYGTRHITMDTMQDLLRVVRAWSSSRDLRMGALGSLSGISWAALCAFVCAHTSTEALHLPGLLRRFMETWASWDWSQPIALSPHARGYKPRHPQDRIIIPANTGPGFNTARHITRSSLRTLEQEFERGLKLTQSASWTALFEPYKVPKNTPAILVTAPDPAVQQAAAGLTQAHLIHTLLPMEKEGVWFRCHSPRTNSQGILFPVQTLEGDPQSTQQALKNFTTKLCNQSSLDGASWILDKTG